MLNIVMSELLHGFVRFADHFCYKLKIAASTIIGLFDLPVTHGTASLAQLLRSLGSIPAGMIRMRRAGKGEISCSPKFT